MSELANQIKQTIWKLIEACKEGRKDGELIGRIMNMIDELDMRAELVRVRAGKYGFCSCRVSELICWGCQKAIRACQCVEMIVTPWEMINDVYARRVKGEEPEERGLDS
jgi:hypothetical protein